jgi:tetratricopeptide (TPR) repeat protein
LTSNGRAESSNATLSRWETILGDAHSELAEYDDALVHYERALGYAGEALPGSLGARALSLVGNLAGQMRLRLLRPAPGGLSPETRARSERIAHIRERLAERHFFRNETVAVLDETLAALNHAERCGAVAETISGYSALALGLGMSGMRASAHFYRSQALGLAEESGSSSAAARAFLLAAVYGYGTGEWGLTESCASRSLALYRELGDSARAPAPLTVQIFSALLRGEIARAEALLPDLDSATARDSTGQGRAWDLAAGVLIALIRGRVDRDAVDLLREAASSKLIRADRLLCLGIAASAYGWLGDGPRAWSVASDGLMVLKETGTVWGSYVYGVSGIVSVLIDAAPKSEENGRFAREAMRHARRATRASAVCRPQSFLMRGRLTHLSARPRRARRLWQKAAAAAERLGMRRDYGLALYEIGRATPPGDTLRSQYLLRAAENFRDARRAKRFAIDPRSFGVHSIGGAFGEAQDRDRRRRHGGACRGVRTDPHANASGSLRRHDLPNGLAAWRQGGERARRQAQLPHRRAWPACLVRLLRERLSPAERRLPRVGQAARTDDRQRRSGLSSSGRDDHRRRRSVQ